LRPSAPRRNERGSIVVAVLVVVIMATLAAAMVDRVSSSSHATVRHRDRIAALDAAEVGLVAAQARISLGVTAAFDDDGRSGDTPWDVSATVVGEHHWQMIGAATAGRVRSTVRAEMVLDGSGRWRRVNWREVSVDDVG